MLLEPRLDSEILDSVKKLSEDTLYFTYKQIDSLLREQGLIKDHFNNQEVEDEDDDYYTCIQYSRIRKSTEQEIEKERLRVEKVDLEFERLTTNSQKEVLFNLAKKFNYTLQENIE